MELLEVAARYVSWQWCYSPLHSTDAVQVSERDVGPGDEYSSCPGELFGSFLTDPTDMAVMFMSVFGWADSVRGGEHEESDCPLEISPWISRDLQE